LSDNFTKLMFKMAPLNYFKIALKLN